MRTGEIADRRRLMDAALGKLACDLTVRNVRLCNVLTGEIYPAEVDILDGAVARVREGDEPAALPAREVLDGGGRYLVPGFIDTHMHVESTMMLPQRLAQAVLPWGTTTVCTDPHEMANVMGLKGVAFMRENGRRAALRQLILAPSCVPAAPGMEGTGAAFGALEVEAILEQPDTVGVAEIMDYSGVIGGSPRMQAILEAGRRRRAFLQGHAPQLRGAALAAYRIAGPASDHESVSAQEVREKLRCGMRVNLRASSIVDQLEELTRGLSGLGWLDLVSICTDDVHAKDLLDKGHVNAIVARLIAGGMEPMQAIKLCTLNAAQEYGFSDLGAIAPGYLADFQLLDALDGRQPHAVFVGGRLAALEGRYVPDGGLEIEVPPPENTMDIRPLGGAADFCLHAPAADSVQVLVMARNGRGLCRGGEWMTLPVENGCVSLTGHPRLQFISVVNRFGAGSRAIAVTQDFALREGAIATTVSHDSHNFTVVYRDAASAFACLKRLKEEGGGLCAARAGKCEACLPLPYGGLMSGLPCEALARRIEEIQAVMQGLCDAPFSLLDLSVYSLPAVPGLVVTDRGIVDCDTQRFLSVLR